MFLEQDDDLMSERQSRVGRIAGGAALYRNVVMQSMSRGTGGGIRFDWQVGRYFASVRPLETAGGKGARLEPMGSFRADDSLAAAAPSTIPAVPLCLFVVIIINTSYLWLVNSVGDRG